MVERIDEVEKEQEKLTQLQKLMQKKFLDSSYPISEHNSGIYIGPPIDKKYIKVSAQGEDLKEGIDYTVNEKLGSLSIINEDLIKKAVPIRVQFDDSHLLHGPIPLFPGCETQECSKEELLKYIYTNIKYPKEMRDKNAQGVMTLEITIDEKGGTSDGFSILKGNFSNGFSEEDLLSNMLDLYKGLGSKGTWTPRIINDRAVSTVMRIPITFKIDSVEPSVLKKLKSDQAEPEHGYDIEFDEIVVVGYGNPKNKTSKN